MRGPALVVRRAEQARMRWTRPLFLAFSRMLFVVLVTRPLRSEVTEGSDVALLWLILTGLMGRCFKASEAP